MLKYKESGPNEESSKRNNFKKTKKKNTATLLSVV